MRRNSDPDKPQNKREESVKLIFGGAFQGKLEQAKKEYEKEHPGVQPVIWDCPPPEKDQTACAEYLQRVDFYADIIDNLQHFTLACSRVGVNPGDILGEYAPALQNKILICTDISQGLVPMEEDLRAWRETNGRTITALAAASDTVIRMFCGIPQYLSKQEEDA